MFGTSAKQAVNVNQNVIMAQSLTVQVINRLKAERELAEAQLNGAASAPKVGLNLKKDPDGPHPDKRIKKPFNHRAFRKGSPPRTCGACMR